MRVFKNRVLLGKIFGAKWEEVKRRLWEIAC
jgi:hypothetical protein